MRLNGLNLNHLVCLEALLRDRNVTRAAERVHLSQSAMSTVLGQLRDHFEDPLLVRFGRALVLTPFAKDLIAPLGDVMSKAHAFATLRPGQRTIDVDRELKIVASDYSVGACLADAIRASYETTPNLRFDVLPLSEGSGKLLANGEIDLLLAGQVLDIGLPPNACLFEDSFVCLACKEHGPPGERISRTEYLDRDHVVVRYFEHQMTFEDEDALRRSGEVRPKQVAVWSFNLVPPLISGTSMIATVPSRIARQIAERWPVKIFPFPFEHEPLRVVAYWHPSRESDEVLARFVASATIT